MSTKPYVFFMDLFCLPLLSVHSVYSTLYHVTFLITDIRYNFGQCKSLRTNFSHLSGRHLKISGLQMNVGATVTAKSSQAWSARGKRWC